MQLVKGPRAAPLANRNLIIALLARHRLPAVYKVPFLLAKAD
jgi:hypothetical protein